MNVNNRKALFAIVLVSVDLILINAGYLISFLIKFGWNIPERNMEAYLSTWPWLTLTALCLLFFYRLYGSYKWRWAEVFASIISCNNFSVSVLAKTAVVKRANEMIKKITKFNFKFFLYISIILSFILEFYKFTDKIEEIYYASLV